MTESRQPNSLDPTVPNSPVARPSDETTIEDLPNRPAYRPAPPAAGGTASGDQARTSGLPADAPAAAPAGGGAAPATAAAPRPAPAAAPADGGAAPATAAAPRRRLALRWVLAILGVVV